jgi:hypothetical protein
MSRERVRRRRIRIRTHRRRSERGDDGIVLPFYPATPHVTERLKELGQPNTAQQPGWPFEETIVQPRLYDSLMVTQITLNTEPVLSPSYRLPAPVSRNLGCCSSARKNAGSRKQGARSTFLNPASCKARP